MIRPSRRVLLAGAAALTTAVAALSATTGVSSAAPSDSSTAVVRGAHFSPDTPGVDVYLTAFSGGTQKLWLSSVGYGDVSPYGRLKPGLYAVSMRPHGQPATTPAALSWTLNAQAGQAYTAAAVGLNAQLHGIVLRDELVPPANGSGRVRVIQAASRAPKAKLVAQNGPVVTDGAAFATSTGYTTVPAGTWPLVATSTTSSTVTTSSKVNIAAGSVSSVVVLDSKGAGIQLRTVTDAAGARISPVGSIDAGGGSTAWTSAEGIARSAFVAGVLVALVGMFVLLRRRVGRSVSGRHSTV